jgi:hypothetical protein
VLDGGSPLPDAVDVELGGVSLDAVEGALLGAADEGVDWLGALDKTALGSDEAAGLTESPELPDCAEGDCWLPLEGTSSLEVGLSDSCDTELAAGLEPADGALLFVVDDVGEALSTLSPLLWPLTGDVLTLVALALLAPLFEPDEITLASDDSPESSDD